MDTHHQIVLEGDSTVVLELEERLAPEVNARAVAVADALARVRRPGVRDVVAGYRTVSVHFDPLRTDLERVIADLESAVRAPHDPTAAAPSRTIPVPVCYGGPLGPDLLDVAAFAGCSLDDAIELHSGRTYRVYMLGFVPGFPYMGIVDPRIAAPRRRTPRLKVPAGSVGIAGSQTGIYPMETPGGWQLIGRTPLRLFDPASIEAPLFRAGDLVVFERIDEQAFDRLARA